MAFRKGHAKIGGRRRGTPNKVTGEAREFVQGLLNNPEYRQSLLKRLVEGKAPRLELRFWDRELGRPPAEEAAPDHAGANGGLSALIERLGERHPQNADPLPPAPPPASDQRSLEEELRD